MVNMPWARSWTNTTYLAILNTTEYEWSNLGFVNEDKDASNKQEANKLSPVSTLENQQVVSNKLTTERKINKLRPQICFYVPFLALALSQIVFTEEKKRISSFWNELHCQKYRSMLCSGVTQAVA